MRESPRLRRLRSDYKAISQLRAESSVLDFVADGNPPESYLLHFQGRGFWRPDKTNDVLVRDQHTVQVDLSASYPRMQPELAWKTPIFHPNISASGVVCLGGYGTYWVPSVNLDELCHMLWDMIRYQNFDVESPYNREAAAWAKSQTDFRLPIDDRPMRDRVAGLAPEFADRKPPIASAPKLGDVADVTFLDPEIVEAEIVEASVGVRPEDPDILFIE